MTVTGRECVEFAHDCVQLAGIHNESFAPEDVAALVTAYEDVLRTLGLTDRNDPVTVLVAKTIIEVAKSGDRNPQRLHLEAVNRLSK